MDFFSRKGTWEKRDKDFVQLKDRQAFNFVININDTLDQGKFTQETNWLISMGASIKDKQLVEEFGSFWPDHQVYTEEYILGETVLQYLNRNEKEISSGKYIDRWQMRWLHFIWNGATAYLDFWKRTGCTRIIKNASPKNVIIPEFDYYTGTNLYQSLDVKRLIILKMSFRLFMNILS